MESWVSFGRKESYTDVQMSEQPGIKLVTLWLEGRDFTNCDNKKSNEYFEQVLCLFCDFTILIMTDIRDLRNEDNNSNVNNKEQ